MIELYHIQREGDPYGGSRNSSKVLIALEEIGEKYDVKLLSRLQDCRPADAPYRKINPNGVVPAISDDGFILWESGAILRYLADSLASTTLIPTDTKQRALVQQWLAWEGTTLNPSLLNLFFAMMAPTPDNDAIATAKAAYLGNLGILDAQLAGKEYVCGSFSMADIALGCIAPISFNLGLDLKPYPHLLAWIKRLGARPAWSKAETVIADMAAGQAQLG